jgi:hypothetical protein
MRTFALVPKPIRSQADSSLARSIARRETRPLPRADYAGLPAVSPPIQRKPAVAAPDDPLEREADEAAERVNRMESPRLVSPAPAAIQRRCASCESEDEEKNQPLFRTTAAPTMHAQAPLDVGAAAREVERGGAPLPPAVRSYFEPRFGHDFSRVRIHADGQAAAAARAVRARAFTLGDHVVFDSGEFAPATAEGRRLIAHELAHVVQQGAARDAGTIRRQTKPSAPTAKDYRDFVQATIDQFNAAAAFFGDPLVKVSAALFEKLINTWYAMVVDREKMIKDQLGGDALLQRDLHAAYIAAIRALVSKNAYRIEAESQGVRKQAEIEDELYRVNSGRIPMWAWPTPHRQEAGFSTPLAEGQAVDILSGNVAFTLSNGIGVTILPDQTDATAKTDGETRINFPFNVPFTVRVPRKGVRIIDGFTPPAPVATIQTVYLPGSNPSGTSGYGRGTTPEDIAGGKVDPASTTVRFHEGSHGLDYQEFLKTATFPTFTGTTGMSEAAFRAAVKAYGNALKAFATQADAFSSRRTHCVGTTIDQYNLAHAAGGTVRLECGP